MIADKLSAWTGWRKIGHIHRQDFCNVDFSEVTLSGVWPKSFREVFRKGFVSSLAFMSSAARADALLAVPDIVDGLSALPAHEDKSDTLGMTRHDVTHLSMSAFVTK